VLPVFRRFVRIAALASGLFLGTPTLAAAAPAAASSNYTVKSGDTLSGIASRFGLSLKTLLQANALTAKTVIRPGQVLKVPTQVAAPLSAGGLPSDINNAEKRALIPLFRASAKEAGVSVDLLMALAYTESRWTQGARSPDRAVGVGQLLPSTSRYISGSIMREPGLNPRNLQDNLRMTAHYLRYLITTFPGNGEKALAAYFEGETSVRRSGPSRSGLQYARKILTRRVMFLNAA
jgi:murein DD-endopeptidase MepM/ murein hydrolase activator NlpD